MYMKVALLRQAKGSGGNRGAADRKRQYPCKKGTCNQRALTTTPVLTDVSTCIRPGVHQNPVLLSAPNKLWRMEIENWPTVDAKIADRCSTNIHTTNNVDCTCTVALSGGRLPTAHVEKGQNACPPKVNNKLPFYMEKNKGSYVHTLSAAGTQLHLDPTHPEIELQHNKRLVRLYVHSKDDWTEGANVHRRAWGDENLAKRTPTLKGTISIYPTRIQDTL